MGAVLATTAILARPRQAREIPGQKKSVMRLPIGLSGIAVAGALGALIVGLAADLVVADSVAAALTRILGASSIGLAVWTLAKIAR